MHGTFADDALREWLLRFKHGGRPDLAEELGLALARAVREAGGPPGPHPFVTAVPLHPLRRIERGYDQADLLARVLAERLGVEHVRALRRSRPTPPQGSAGTSRRDNVRGAFEVRVPRERLRGRSVLLVDDVVASGGTVRACARALRERGALRVWIVAVARGGDRRGATAGGAAGAAPT
ncbi:MAG: phosphoribosyltransferase family protein [Planctomycetota bacterium]